MSRLPLQSFFPLKSNEAIIRLVNYLAVLKVKDRYSISECLYNISDDDGRIFFCKKLIEKNIGDFSNPDIRYWIKEGERIATKKAEHKAIQERKRQREFIEQQRLEEKNKRAQERLLADKLKQEKKEAKKAAKLAQKEKYKSTPIVSAPQTGKITTTTINRVIARGVDATSFLIEKGVIKYGDYELRSVRIEEDIPIGILERISHKFTLLKDFSKSNQDSKRFIFEPASDFSLLLANCKRFRQNPIVPQKIKTYPSNGAFHLPWDRVMFTEGRMYLTHPNSYQTDIDAYEFIDARIHKSFRDIIDYIISKCPKFLVTCKDDTITGVTNFEEFAKMIPHLVKQSTFDDSDVELTGHRMIVPIAGNGYSLTEFRESKLIKKSPYLSLLSKHHFGRNKIYYLLEKVVHESSDISSNEYGYLFTYNGNRSCDISIYENVSDESRSSLVFFIRKGQFDKALKYISQFLSSTIENKRLKLAYGTIRLTDSSIISLKRIAHTNMNDWRDRILSVIRGY